MFVTALFITVPKEKGPRCPSTDERTGRMWRVPTRADPWAGGRHGVLTHATTGMSLESCREKALRRRPRVVWFHSYETPRTGKSEETKTLVVA